MEDSISEIDYSKPRQGWDEAFAKMRERGDDELLIESVLSPDDWD